VVGLAPERAVRFDVAQRCHLELERAEALGEGDLLGMRQVLRRKDQERVLKPGLVERAERGLLEFCHLDAADDRTEGGVDRFDSERASHAMFLLSVHHKANGRAMPGRSEAMRGSNATG